MAQAAAPRAFISQGQKRRHTLPLNQKKKKQRRLYQQRALDSDSGCSSSSDIDEKEVQEEEEEITRPYDNCGIANNTDPGRNHVHIDYSAALRTGTAMERRSHTYHDDSLLSFFNRKAKVPSHPNPLPPKGQQMATGDKHPSASSSGANGGGLTERKSTVQAAAKTEQDHQVLRQRRRQTLHRCTRQRRPHLPRLIRTMRASPMVPTSAAGNDAPLWRHRMDLFRRIAGAYRDVLCQGLVCAPVPFAKGYAVTPPWRASSSTLRPYVSSIAYDSSGSLAIAGSTGGSCFVYDIDDTIMLWREYLNAAAVHKDQEYCAGAEMNHNGGYVRDMRNAAVLRSLGMIPGEGGEHHQLARAADGPNVGSLTGMPIISRAARRPDWQTEEIVQQVRMYGAVDPEHLHSPLVPGELGYGVTLPRPVAALDIPGYRISCVQWNGQQRENEMVLCSSQHRSVYLYDAARLPETVDRSSQDGGSSGCSPPPLRTMNHRDATSVGFADCMFLPEANGRMVACAAHEGSIVIWDTRAKRRAKRISCISNRASATPGGKQLVKVLHIPGSPRVLGLSAGGCIFDVDLRFSPVVAGYHSIFPLHTPLGSRRLAHAQFMDAGRWRGKPAGDCTLRAPGAKGAFPSLASPLLLAALDTHCGVYVIDVGCLAEYGNDDNSHVILRMTQRVESSFVPTQYSYRPRRLAVAAPVPMSGESPPLLFGNLDSGMSVLKWDAPSLPSTSPHHCEGGQFDTCSCCNSNRPDSKDKHGSYCSHSSSSSSCAGFNDCCKYSSSHTPSCGSEGCGPGKLLGDRLLSKVDVGASVMSIASHPFLPHVLCGTDADDLRLVGPAYGIRPKL